MSCDLLSCAFQLSLQPVEGLVEVVEERMRNIDLSHMDEQTISDILWAFSEMGIQPSSDLVELLEARRQVLAALQDATQPSGLLTSTRKTFSTLED